MPPIKILTFFYLLFNFLLLFYLFKRNSQQRYILKHQTQDLQEELNILNDQNLKDEQNNAGLKAKISRYKSLKNVVEKINEKLDLDSVGEQLSSLSFSLICHNQGTAILYLINKELNLQIFKTKREDDGLIIQAKQGDIFDFWVLRHNSALLVEDTKKDFRFDLEKLKIQDLRQIGSLISSSLVSEHHFLGTLRLDNPRPHFFSQDDLRFLVTLCDLGAVALENSELFQRAKELAIHDGLTSLFTKGHFLEELKNECKRGIQGGRVFSLLMLDIDFFKNYNDKFGHTAGDIVLKNLSHNIVESLKDINPILSRFGGEEFCIILPDIDKQKASLLAENLRKKIENEKINLRRYETNITVSIGIASFPTDAVSEDELILKSDRAMYEAKQKGRNQVICA